MTLSKKLTAALLSGLLILGSGSVLAQEQADGEVVDETGTDPRDFRTKFMPYANKFEFEDGTELSTIAMFGMIRLGKGMAMTYEVPIAQEIDFSDTDGFPQFDFISGEPIKNNYQGLGDSNIRGFKMIGEYFGMRMMVGAEIGLPTHSEDYLGSDEVIFGAMFVNVMDLSFLPMPGAFLAQMHFYDFDIYKGDRAVTGCFSDGIAYRTRAECQERGINQPEIIGYEELDDTSRYRGRWFAMIPLNKEYKIYSLTEMQPVYDFETSHFSFWIAPEIGTAMFGPLLYVKPGWGINPKVEQHPDGSINDREFTFEIGMRFMEF